MTTVTSIFNSTRLIKAMKDSRPLSSLILTFDKAILISAKIAYLIRKHTRLYEQTLSSTLATA